MMQAVVVKMVIHW